MLQNVFKIKGFRAIFANIMLRLMKHIRKYEIPFSITVAFVLTVFVWCFPIFNSNLIFEKQDNLNSQYSVTSFYVNYHAPYSSERVNTFNVSQVKSFIGKYFYHPNEISVKFLDGINSTENFNCNSSPTILEKNCILRI